MRAAGRRSPPPPGNRRCTLALRHRAYARSSAKHPDAAVATSQLPRTLPRGVPHLRCAAPHPPPAHLRSTIPASSSCGTRKGMTSSNRSLKRGRRHSSWDHAASGALGTAGALPPPAASTETPRESLRPTPAGRSGRLAASKPRQRPLLQRCGNQLVNPLRAEILHMRRPATTAACAIATPIHLPHPPPACTGRCIDLANVPVGTQQICATCRSDSAKPAGNYPVLRDVCEDREAVGVVEPYGDLTRELCESKCPTPR